MSIKKTYPIIYPIQASRKGFFIWVIEFPYPSKRPIYSILSKLGNYILQHDQTLVLKHEFFSKTYSFLWDYKLSLKITQKMLKRGNTCKRKYWVISSTMEPSQQWKNKSILFPKDPFYVHRAAWEIILYSNINRAL